MKAMYCTKCGRKLQGENCQCVKTSKVSSFDANFVLWALLFAPLITNGIIVNISSTEFKNLNYLFYGNLSLAIILLFFVLLNLLFKTKHLPLFFNCHQRVERSFVVCNRPLVLCARCTGILIGVYFSLIITYIGIPMYIYFISGIPLVVDGLVQAKTSYISNNLKRFTTGFLFALTLVAIYSIFNYYLQFLIFLNF